MYLKPLLIVAVLLLATFVATDAFACPFCHPPSGVNQVKAGIFNATFFVRAAAGLHRFRYLRASLRLSITGHQSSALANSQSREGNGNK